jgi:hypothetical protein
MQRIGEVHAAFLPVQGLGDLLGLFDLDLR